MRQSIISASILILILSISSCKVSNENPSEANSTVVATEVWYAIVNNDSSNYGTYAFEKYDDGSIKASGSWVSHYNGAEVKCPFAKGEVIIKDSVVSFSGQGTATNLSAPVGYQNSPFTMSSTGIVKNGQATGSYYIKFTMMGWPDSVGGNFVSHRTSGSGITK